MKDELELQEELEAQVQTLAVKAGAADDSGNAQRFAQAALNLAHAFATLEGIKAIVPASR